MAKEQAAGVGNGLTLEFVAKATLIVIVLVALSNVLWMARQILFITFFAMLVASFLSIFVEPLHRRGIRRSISAPVVLLLLVGVLAALFALTWPTLSAQVSVIQSQLPPTIERLQTWVEQQLAGVMGSFGQDGEQVQQRLRNSMSQQLTVMIGGTLPMLNTAIGALTGIVLVVVAGMFIAISPRTYMHGMIVLIPRTHRKRAGEVLPQAGVAMVQWMKGTALGMIVVGTMSGLGLWLIGVPAAFALGIIAGLLEFIPYVGPALSFVPATVVAFAISPEKGFWVLGLYALVQGIESNVLTPLLMKKMVELPPALTLLFQAMMATLFGFLGLLLAVPILATSKILIQEFYVEGVADEH